MPFQPRFEDVTNFQRDVYFVTLLFSALATALLIAPTAYHRLNFRQGDKEHIVAGLVGADDRRAWWRCRSR